MHYSDDDDVVIIDSSSTVSRKSPAAEFAALNSSHGSSDFEFDDEGNDNEERNARPPLRQEAGTSNNTAAAPPQRPRTAHDATCQRIEQQLHAITSPRSTSDTQTDAGISTATAAHLHQHLMELDAALGIPVSSLPVSAPAASPHDAVQHFINAWRRTAKGWKRPRGDGVAAENAPRAAQSSDDVAFSPEEEEEKEEEREAVKHAKAECCTDNVESAPISFSSAPAWAQQVCAALEQTERLLQSTTNAEDAMRGEHSAEERRAQLAAPFTAEPTRHSAYATPPEDRLFSLMRDSDNATPGKVSSTGNHKNNTNNNESDDFTNDSAAPLSLLREAEIICAREQKESLLPLYSELYTLRRQHLHQQQDQARSTAVELQWEQRLLTDVMTECEQQLELVEADFVEKSRGGLVPLDALQHRMQLLQRFRHELRSAQAATAPVSTASAFPPATSQQLDEEHTRSAGVHDGMHTARPLGKAAEVAKRHLEEERDHLQAELAAVRQELQQQQRRNTELEACYAHATAQVQRTLDAGNYIDKDAISALKRQQRAELAALAQQFGWTLVNSTPDVLSLRHPQTGEVLHANHTYATINGRPCEGVAKALAEYVVRHTVAYPRAPEKSTESTEPSASSPSASEEEDAPTDPSTEQDVIAAEKEVPTPAEEANVEKVEETSAQTSPCDAAEPGVGSTVPEVSKEQNVTAPVKDEAALASSGAHDGEPIAREETAVEGAAVPGSTPGNAQPVETTLQSTPAAPAPSFSAFNAAVAPGDGNGVDKHTLPIVLENDGVSSSSAQNVKTQDDAGPQLSAHSDDYDDVPSSEQPSQEEEEDEEGGEGEGEEEESYEGDEEVDDYDENNEEEEEEEEEEEFVNYSNLQSEEAQGSRQEGSSVVNTSTEASHVSNPTAATHSAEKAGQSQKYTGFFSENALWEDEN